MLRAGRGVDASGRSGLTTLPVRMTGMGNSRLAYVGVPLALVAGTALAACSNDQHTDPQPAIDALVTAFAIDDFSDVPFDGDRATAAGVKKEYDAVVVGLGEVKPKVTATATTQDSDARATATLHWTWPIGGGWSYSTKASLISHDGGDTWQVRWGVD